MYSVFTVIGGGTLFVTDYPDSTLSADAQFLAPVPFSAITGDTELPLNDIGSRFFLRVGTNAVGDWFQLSKIAMTMQRSPWAPVKGGTY